MTVNEFRRLFDALILTNGTTIMARLQQFAGRVYGPVVGTGLSWWVQKEGNFWGHNAIIRTEAFLSSAGLPELSGKPPFGGHIMSHDFVEAALIRRAGGLCLKRVSLNRRLRLLGVRVGTLSRADAQPPRPRPKRPPPMPQTAPADAPLTQTLPLFPDES